MSDEKIILDCDHFGFGAVGKLIICAPTNIICTVQAGGQVCDHPESEGFPMDICIWCEESLKSFHKALGEFDDCNWGCNLSTIEGVKCLDDYGKAIDEFLSKNLNNQTLVPMSFEFDHSRITELMEGWWPVLASFKNTETCRDEKIFYKNKFKGYLYFGNCD